MQSRESFKRLVCWPAWPASIRFRLKHMSIVLHAIIHDSLPLWVHCDEHVDPLFDLGRRNRQSNLGSCIID